MATIVSCECADLDPVVFAGGTCADANVPATIQNSPLKSQNFSFPAQSFLQRGDKYYSSNRQLQPITNVKIMLRLIQPAIHACISLGFQLAILRHRSANVTRILHNEEEEADVEQYRPAQHFTYPGPGSVHWSVL